MLVRMVLSKGISAPNGLQPRLPPAGPWQREVRRRVYGALEAAEGITFVFVWDFLRSDSTTERTALIYTAVAPLWGREAEEG